MIYKGHRHAVYPWTKQDIAWWTRRVRSYALRLAKMMEHRLGPRTLQKGALRGPSTAIRVRRGISKQQNSRTQRLFTINEKTWKLMFKKTIQKKTNYNVIACNERSSKCGHCIGLQSQQRVQRKREFSHCRSAKNLHDETPAVNLLLDIVLLYKCIIPQTKLSPDIQTS